MEVRGKLVKKLAAESGVSQAGKQWKKQSILIDTGGEFNNEVCISAFGDKMDSMNKLEVGMDVSVLCNVYSREYNGRYFHNIDGYFFTNESDKASGNLLDNKDNMLNGEGDLPF